MKIIKKLIYLNVVLILAAGCSDSAVEDHEPIATESNTTVEQAEDPSQSEDTVVEEETIEEEAAEEPAETSDAGKQEELSQYSAEQIEYARVWLQLGPNQDIDGLYVEHIPAGTALNPKDETSDVYPDDVIQLSGSRLVDGSITYSGNGDGTINVYNVPKRWDGVYPVEDENFYTEIIEGTEKVYVETGDPTDVEALIGLIEG